jgi:hypothetical protein
MPLKEKVLKTFKNEKKYFHLPIKRARAMAIALTFTSVMTLSFLSSGIAAAACSTTPNASNGTDTETVNVTSAGNYYVYARELTQNTTDNSFYLQVNGGCAISMGGGSSIPANSWTWVNYQNGSTSSAVTVPLTAGSNTIVMTGESPNVGIDRVLFLGDTSCAPPVGNGNNCVATAPSVSMTAPSNGASVSGSVTVSASASEAGANISKVQFMQGSSTLGAAVTTPVSGSTYSTTWNTTGLATGSYPLTAVATDSNNVSTTSAPITVSVTNSGGNGGSTPAVNITTPSNNQTVGGTVSLNAVATDTGSTVSKVQFVGDSGTTLGPAITSAGANGTYSYSWNSSSISNGKHNIYAVVTDAKGNTANSAKYSITVNNSTPPVTVTGLSFNRTTDVLSWNAYSGANNYSIAQVHNVNVVPTSSSYRTPTDYSWPHVTGTSCVVGGTGSSGCGIPVPAANEVVNYGIIANDANNNALSGLSWSPELTNTYSAPTGTVPPTAPGNVAASAASSSQINLTWNASTDSDSTITGYKVYRSQNGGSFGLLQTTTGSATGFADTGLAASTTYSYYVVAVNAASQTSSNSNTASATTQAITKPTTATVTGVVYYLNGSTKVPINGACVTTGTHATKTGSEKVCTNSSGQYTLVNILANSGHHYNYAATGYKSRSIDAKYPVGTTTVNEQLTAK